MTINIFTLALDGLAFLQSQLQCFNRLNCDWHWVICEGVADNHGSTAWCKSIPARLSRDGSHEWLLEVADRHPRITHLHSPLWPSKDHMCNAALERFTKPGLLWQIDSDELWRPEDIEAAAMIFGKNPQFNCGRFRCRYFLGPNIIITSQNTYGNKPGEWLRVWRWQPGMKFTTHEPPRLSGPKENGFTPDIALNSGVRPFDHYAYAYEWQVRFKEQFYGYANALNQWRRLQENPIWPCKARLFLPWIADDATADLLFHPI